MAARGRPTKLNQAVQSKIVALLKAGVSISDACANSGITDRTFYAWLERAENGDEEFLQFSQKVNRARNDAKVTAVQTLRTAMTPTISRTRKIHRVTETRENIYGKPYEYTLVDENEYVTENPGDWRAAVEYLKRRFPDEWSEKRILELGLTPQSLERLEQIAKRADVPASLLFENMLNELANQLPVGSTEGDSESES